MTAKADAARGRRALASLKLTRLAVASRAAVAVCLAALCYVAALSTASILRHDGFGSGYDVAIFDQGVWLLGHGHDPFSTVRGRHLFGDHFQPAVVLLAPLGALGLTPAALFILQAALLGAAAPALYVLARLRGASSRLALAVALLWLASPLVQWANLFEFHPETAAPLLFAVGAVQLERGRIGWFAATAVLASCLKEDVSLVYLMWGVVLVLERRRRLGLSLIVAATAWFAVVTKVLIPAFGGSLDYYSARFGGDRGSSLGAVFLGLAEHPLRTLGDTATPVNAKLVLALVLCSGGLSLLAPRMLLLALPPVAANLLSAYAYQHELRFHYQLVPAGAVAVASAYGAGVLTHRMSGPRVLRFVEVALAAVLVAMLALSPALRELRRHRGGQDAEAKRRALALVPGGVPVAAAVDLVPHLTHRVEAYQLPEPFLARPTNGEYWTPAQLARRARDVRYVLYDLDNLDPGPRAQMERLPALLRHRGFVEIFRKENVRVFRRRSSRGS